MASDDTTTADAEPIRRDRTWLEAWCGFKDSVIWTQHRDYYVQRGPSAWRNAVVPTQVTTNTFIAEAYAGMIIDHLRDSRLDPTEPVYVVEMGAGSGRMAFHMVEALRRLRLPNTPRMVYVMSDISPHNVHAWESNEQLKQSIEEGALDTALFDCEAPGPMRLRHSDVLLKQRSQTNPVVVIANYLFDSLRHDLLRFEQGAVHHVQVRASVDVRGTPDLQFRTTTATTPIYNDLVKDSIVEEYRGVLQASVVLFPSMGIDLLTWCASLSQRGMMLLMADKMRRQTKDLDGLARPHIAHHGADGAISVAVNAHAISRFFEHHGGTVKHGRSSDDGFTISAFLTATEPQVSAAFERHFANWLDDPGPADVHRMWEAITSLKRGSVGLIVLMLRMVRYDDHTFMKAAGALPGLAPGACPQVRTDLACALREVWRRAFIVGSADLAFSLGRVFSALNEHEDGAQMYLHSLNSHGPHHVTLHNLALSYEGLGQRAKAVQHMSQALRTRPDYELARRWLDEHS